MGRKGKYHERDVSPQGSRRPLPRLMLLAFCILLVGGILFALSTRNPRATATRQPSPDVVRYAQKAKSLDELLKMSSEQLADVDIAELNLLCATGLPGGENLDIAKCLAHLDDWARRVKFDTDRHLYKFDKNPAEYENSEGYFRMLMLVTILQQDCGVHYNLERIRNIDFTKSKDLFIHGMIDDPNGGTCVTMPVMYVAVARRLGYPVKLVLTKAHVFCRWDAPGERFNIEATNQGMNCFSDDYYKTWPEKWTTAETQSNRYLISLTPAEELACFLGSRGHCLLDTGRTKDAFDSYAAAHRLAPRDPAYTGWMRMAQSRLPGYRDPLAEAEYLSARQQEAARREWLSSQGRRPPGVPPLYGPQAPQRYAPQPPYPSGPHTPAPYAPQPPMPYPSPYGPRPGTAGQPLMPGQP